jgi:putative protease
MVVVKKKVVKKVVGKEKKTEVKEKKEGNEVGKVSGWFSHVSVAAIKLTAPLKVGDKIHFKGHTTDFEEKVSSMQIENKVVKEAKKGDHIGIKVKDKVRPNDQVLLVK